MCGSFKLETSAAGVNAAWPGGCFRSAPREPNLDESAVEERLGNRSIAGVSGHEIIESTVESLDGEERVLLMERIEAA